MFQGYEVAAYASVALVHPPVGSINGEIEEVGELLREFSCPIPTMFVAVEYEYPLTGELLGNKSESVEGAEVPTPIRFCVVKSLGDVGSDPVLHGHPCPFYLAGIDSQDAVSDLGSPIPTLS